MTENLKDALEAVQEMVLADIVALTLKAETDPSPHHISRQQNTLKLALANLEKALRLNACLKQVPGERDAEEWQRLMAQIDAEIAADDMADDTVDDAEIPESELSPED